MPIDVGRFSTEVTAIEGDLPLPPAQVEKLVQVVLKRLEERERAARQSREATALRPHSAPRPGR